MSLVASMMMGLFLPIYTLVYYSIPNPVVAALVATNGRGDADTHTRAPIARREIESGKEQERRARSSNAAMMLTCDAACSIVITGVHCSRSSPPAALAGGGMTFLIFRVLRFVRAASAHATRCERRKVCCLWYEVSSVEHTCRARLMSLCLIRPVGLAALALSRTSASWRRTSRWSACDTPRSTSRT
jgi:hypothetical protein